MYGTGELYIRCDYNIFISVYSCSQGNQSSGRPLWTIMPLYLSLVRMVTCTLPFISFFTRTEVQVSNTSYFGWSLPSLSDAQLISIITKVFIAIIIIIIWTPAAAFASTQPPSFLDFSGARTHSHTHTSGNIQSVYMCGEGATSLSALSVSLQSWAAGAAQAERRARSDSRSVRHRQTDRQTSRQPERHGQSRQTDGLWTDTQTNGPWTGWGQRTQSPDETGRPRFCFWGDLDTWNNGQPFGRFNPVLTIMEYLFFSFSKFLLSSSSPSSSTTSTFSSSFYILTRCWRRCARMRLLRTSIAIITDSASAF